MKKALPHLGEVASVLYGDEDKCLITVGWDRSLRVYAPVLAHLFC